MVISIHCTREKHATPAPAISGTAEASELHHSNQKGDGTLSISFSCFIDLLEQLQHRRAGPRKQELRHEADDHRQ